MGTSLFTCFLMFVLWFLCYFVLICDPIQVSCEEHDSSNARGFGDHIQWETKLETGFEKAISEDKPLMLLIHKSWCGACKALKPKFADSADIGKLSKNYVMVNLVDDDEPDDPKYHPDGGYVPRILFFTPDGILLDDVYNEGGNPNYIYYYFEPESIVKSMKKAMVPRHIIDEL